MTSTETPGSAGTRTVQPRPLALAMIVALLGELLLGLGNTFWLKLPESGSGWKSATPQWLLMTHMTLGVALVVLAAWIGYLAVRAADRLWSIVTVAGVVGVLIAAGAGSAFMGDTSNDVASFVMSLGWTLALGAYALGLYPISSTPEPTL